MTSDMDSDGIEGALTAVGELPAADRQRVAVVVVGGATMNLLGYVRGTTRDVDVIARAHPRDDGTMRLERAEPLPPALKSAILTVARDFRLAESWMNTSSRVNGRRDFHQAPQRTSPGGATVAGWTWGSSAGIP